MNFDLETIVDTFIIVLKFLRIFFLRQDKMFHFWFNTFFVANLGNCRLSSNGNDPMLEGVKEPLHTDPEQEILMVKLKKHELDKANKDKTNKLYSPNFKVSYVIKLN